ncbi:nickel-binding protein [Ancylomarina sp. YFZ004]
MPLYMDIHIVDSDSFTVEDVVKAHMEDLAVQERFGVIQKKYWVNEDAKTLFCLMEGPNKEACNEVHKESHGNTACNIIEVLDDEFNLFLGVGNSVNDLAYTVSGELDTGYRTLLTISLVDLTGQYGHYTNEIHLLIEAYKGVVLIQPEDDIMASFIGASDAILCALEIGKLLKSIPDNFEFYLSLVSGKPVDEKGEHLFEGTKKKGRYLSALGLKRSMYIDTDTKALSSKETHSPTIKKYDFRVLKNEDFSFLFQLVDSINKELFNPDFKSEDLSGIMGLSKSQTYRKIKSLTGLAPNQLIQELRLRQSLKTLKLNRQTIAEIAYDLGFNSPTYFTRVFRKRYHILPTSFIKLSSP